MIKKRKITSVEQPYDSSTLHSYWYHAASERLRVKFKTKDPGVFNVYLYHDVPADIVEKVRKASSQGMYFHSLIKGKYETEKLE